MPNVAWAGHHRIWHLGIGVGILVVIAAALAAVWFLLFRSPSTEVGLRQALHLYRGGHSGSQRGLPSPGVYRYATSGSEDLSVAGATRTFPTTSYLIVQDDGCATERWEPDEQHVEGLLICPTAGGGLASPRATTQEQIAGMTTTDVITCPATTVFLPARPRVGQRWQATCQTPGSTVTLTGQVVGDPSVEVGGQAVPAVHTRLTFTFAGDQRGTNPTDYWVAPTTGLILRERESVDLSDAAGPFGSVRYTERMAIALASTAPAR
jgi:hypothetical protein